MKIKIISVSLFVVLSSMMAISCQKENFIDDAPEAIVSEVYLVQYTINGMMRSVAIHNDIEEQAWMRFVDPVVGL